MWASSACEHVISEEVINAVMHVVGEEPMEAAMHMALARNYSLMFLLVRKESECQCITSVLRISGAVLSVVADCFSRKAQMHATTSRVSLDASAFNDKDVQRTNTKE